MKKLTALLLAVIFVFVGCEFNMQSSLPDDTENISSDNSTDTASTTSTQSDTDINTEEDEWSFETFPDPSDTDDTSSDETTTEEETTRETHTHSSDPYATVSESEFYSDYTEACCLEDAKYRTKHGYMSGSIEAQDQKPTLSPVRPKENGKYVRNTACIYEDSGNTYCVLNYEGEIVNRIYKGGGYVVLEEVAAYVLAFGEIPPNHSESKNTSPSSSVWGEYLRVNHTYFSGNTNRYPYEPVLPDISGCGGDIDYYEMDIGTTGTDCDPSYRPAVYNNGSKITRGAARIVYTVYDRNGDKIIDPNEKYVFYTYNHYNDFQEYLNYEGGWGEMFGNVTGGGTLSSKHDYNPTDYVQTARANFRTEMRRYVVYMPMSYCAVAKIPNKETF